MLAAPNTNKPSRLPTILIAVALASAVAYFAFFRHKPEAPPAPPSPAPVAAPVRLEPPVVAEAPKPEPARADVRREVAKKAAAAAPAPLPVSYTPPAGYTGSDSFTFSAQNAGVTVPHPPLRPGAPRR